MQTNEKREPFFITPKRMSDLSDDDLDRLLEDIRERRLAAINIFKEKEKMKAEAQAEKQRSKIEKQFDMLKKEIDQMDKVIAKIEKRVTGIRAIQVELGVYDL